MNTDLKIEKVYKGFAIIYDNSITGHVLGWYKIPAIEKRSFSIQGCKTLITKYLKNNQQ